MKRLVWDEEMNMATSANIHYLFAEPWMRLSHALVDLRSMVGVENQNYWSSPIRRILVMQYFGRQSRPNQ